MFDAEQKGHIYNAYLDGYRNAASMGTETGTVQMNDLSATIHCRADTISEKLAYAQGLHDGRLTGENHTGDEPRSSDDLIAVVTAAMQVVTAAMQSLE